jgi:flagellar biosynthesis chaperone FliJ
MSRLTWVAVSFAIIMAWLVLDYPIYQKQVDELGLRIKDHVEQIGSLEQDMDKFRDRWLGQ